MTTTRHGSRDALTFLAAAFVLLVACLLSPSAARAQWTQPDANNNISNTNTGNVGVGTTTPGFRFEVRGASSRNTAAFTGDGDSVGFAGIRIGAFTTTGIASNRTSSFNLHMRKDSWYGGDGSGPSFIIETTSKTGGFAAPFMISPINDIILNGGQGASNMAVGRVGIGTTAPGFKLDVQGGQVNASGGLCIAGDCKTAWSQLGSQWANSGSNLYFNTGNVGFGTSSPAFKLDAAGAIRGTGDSNVTFANQSDFTGGGQQHYFDSNPAFAALGRGGAVINGTSTGPGSNPGGIFIGGGGGQNGGAAGVFARGGDTGAEDYNRAWGGVGLFAQGGQNGPHTGGPYGWAYSRYAAAAFFNGYVQIGSNDGRQSGLAVGFDSFNGYGAKLPPGGGLLVNGSVGVGTAAPGFKLDVQGGQLNASGGLCIAGDCRVSWAQVTNGSGATQWSNGTSGVISYNAGNVGIGTASPATKLSIGGQADNLFQVVSTGSAATDTVANFSSAVGNIMLVRGNGNVGIGVASPAVKLHVGGGARLDGTAGRVYLGTGAVVGARGLEIVEESATTFSIRHHDPNVAWRNIALNPYGGNVGVGTASPVAKMDVRVTSLSAGSNTALWSPSGATDANTSYAHFGTTGDWYIRPGTTTGKVIMADNGGTVGVGTASPNTVYRLDVAGSVNASGLCIGGTCKGSWSEVGGGAASQWANGSAGAISYGSGNVGIGNGSPGSQLFVGSGAPSVTTLPGINVALGPASGSYVATSNGTVNTFFGADGSPYGIVGTLSNHPLGLRANNTLAVTVMPNGNVGIGTATPARTLEVARAVAGDFGGLHIYNAAGAPYNSTDSVTLSLGRSATHVMGQITASNKQSGTFGDGFLAFSLRRADVVTERMRIDEEGRVGIGKTNPTEALDVVGNIRATGSVSATYQDVAEWVPSAQKLSAGTVVVLDTAQSNHVVASAEAYDTKVAGVISETPGVILGVGGEGKLKVATTGRVRVRVDATRGAIKVGDLLVTGEIEGVAMKSVPVDLGGTRIHRPGTIIGKALEPLEKGVGEILVLLSLQ